MARELCLLWIIPVLATAVYGTEKTNSKDASVDKTQRSSADRVGPNQTPMIIAKNAALSLRRPYSVDTLDRETKHRYVRRNIPHNAYSVSTTAATPSVRYITRGDRRVRKHPLCYFTALPCPHKRRQRRNSRRP
ncbi:hypothetical protein AAVH_27887 [Aphelenchoides avenae]|nr:hypothetical protein AAVH_27887 [Aphelenchus avenae]